MMLRKQQGATLIELMISLVLSLSLIAGIGSLFQQMLKSNQAQRAISYMMDDSRYALEILQKEIRYTGGLRSRSDKNGTSDKVFIALNPLDATKLGSTAPFGFATSQYIKGNLSNPRPANDSFIIRYQLVDASDLSDTASSNSSSPCTQKILLNPGEDPAVDVHVVTVYFYVSNGTLMCTAQRVMIDVDTATPTCIKNCALTDAPASLITNVAQLVAAYGVDADNDHAANYYVDALSIPTGPPNLWQEVVSLRLSLVLKSAEDHLAQTVVPYTVDGKQVTPASNDRSLYRVFSTTIALRNQI